MKIPRRTDRALAVHGGGGDVDVAGLRHAAPRRGRADVPYAAVFSDVFGLREGDDVRMAGVRVGRVEKIELQGDLAKVSFVVQSDQQLLGPTVASVTYQNIVGQRYLGLSLGNIGEPGPLPAGSVIPIERTDPSFDVGAMLNGYRAAVQRAQPARRRQPHQRRDPVAARR